MNFDPDKGEATPESVYENRRSWIARTAQIGGLAAIGAGSWAVGRRWWLGSDEQVLEGGAVEPHTKTKKGKQRVGYYPYPAKRDDRFQYGREETDRVAAARYTNFFEFTRTKATWRYIDKFKPDPWSIEVSGLCDKPLKLGLDDFVKRFKSHYVERLYRHRCVEKWAMAIPWTGIPLSALLKAVGPKSGATHVRFVAFKRPKEASIQQSSAYPWPYVEGLTLPEAMNDLTLLCTGIYGKPLLKQHGAPIRIVVPWKYGFKSIKSIERIELVKAEPKAFWTVLNPRAYPFQANVNPNDVVPWDQSREWMLGSKEEFPTKLYNGYGKWVGELYKA